MISRKFPFIAVIIIAILTRFKFHGHVINDVVYKRKKNICIHKIFAHTHAYERLHVRNRVHQRQIITKVGNTS